MSRKELTTILQNIKNERRGGAPREGWVSQNREILMMQVRNTTDASTKRTFGGYVHHFFASFVPMETVKVAAHALGVFVLMVGIAAGGGLASAQVYSNAVPGDMFYGMKLAVERAQLLLAPNREYRTRLHTEFADRRIDEVARLAEGDALQQRLVPQALVAFENELASLADGLADLRMVDPEGVVEVAKLMERKMAVYQKMLRTAGMNLPAESRTAVALTRNKLDDVTIKALAVIVEKHREGDVHAPRTVVVTKLDQQIKTAEESIDASVAKVETTSATATRAKQAIADARALIEEEKYEAALVKITEVAELTKATEEEGDAEAVEAEATEEEGIVAEEEAPSQEEPSQDANATQE